MTATVQAKGVGAGFGDRELFPGVDLVVAPGDVIGLVGPNGAGQVDAAADPRRPSRPADSGSVAVSPAHAQLGLPGAGDRAARRASPCATHLGAAHRRRARADRHGRGRGRARRGRARGPTTSTPRRSRRWLALGGADLDARLGTVADDLGLTVDLDHPMTALSGGQAARVGLAALLLSRYDLYLLDEPTNDLDADGLDLLEEFVDRSEARDRRREPRPRVPQPHRDGRRRDRPQPAARQPSTAAATTPTSRSARSPGARRARRTRGTRPGATRSTRARGCSARGWRRASATRGARRPTTTSTSSTSAARRRRSRRPRPGRPTR